MPSGEFFFGGIMKKQCLVDLEQGTAGGTAEGTAEGTARGTAEGTAESTRTRTEACTGDTNLLALT